MATRTQVAQYVAKSIKSGDKQRRHNAIAGAAKWLKDSNKIRQSDYLIRDINYELSKSGYIYAVITSAHNLDDKTITKINDYIKTVHDADYIELKFIVDPGILGGVIIETPIGLLDTSVKARLSRIVEGASL